jgi:hypothetical protein
VVFEDCVELLLSCRYDGGRPFVVIEDLCREYEGRDAALREVRLFFLVEFVV